MNTYKIKRNYKVPAMKLLAIMVIALALTLSANPSHAQNANSVFIRVGQNIQAIVDDNPAGTTYVLESGIHRLQSINPDNGDTFIGEAGAILSGANLLTSFARQNGYWVADYQTTPGRRAHNHCIDTHPLCYYPEDLFIDNFPLHQVRSLQDLTAGRWYFDYDAGRVYIADDPSGHIVEISKTTLGFSGNSSDVTISDLIIEKYANPAQRGAIYGAYTDGWTISNVTVQLNHGAGIRVGDRMHLINSRIIYNGQLGVGGSGEGYVIEGNEIAYNNYAGYISPWEAGGTKFAVSNNYILRNNYVHHNDGPGLWDDINNYDVLIEGNITFYNQRNGIYHEISGSAVIRNNVAMFNGLNGDNWLWGSQILIATSEGNQVYDNIAVVDETRGNGIGVVNQNRGSWQSHNNYVHDNTIIFLGSSGSAGVVTDYNLDEFWVNGNNRFNANTYYVADSARRYWSWNNRHYTFDELQAQGVEANGQIIVGIPDDAHIIPAWGNNLVSYPEIDANHDTHILNLLLFDATTNRPISGLVDGMTVDLEALGTTEIDIRANYMGDTDSVAFVLNNQTVQVNNEPFMMLAGRDDQALASGDYTLTVIPANNAGEAGVSYTISFTVVNGSGDPIAIAIPATATNTPVPVVGSIINFSLVNTDTQETISTLEHNQVINLADLETDNLNIVANMDDQPFESVIFTLNGETRIENLYPYALWGDENGSLRAWNPEVGTYTLEAVAYSGHDAEGQAGDAHTVTFTIVNDVLEYQLLTDVVGQGQITISPAQDSYPAGTRLELNAIPADGWEFIAWTGDVSTETASVTLSSLLNRPTYTMTINEDSAITAIFRETNITDTSGIGLTASYYNTINGTTPDLVRIDPTVRFKWSGASPDASIDNDTFYVVWEGWVEASYDGDFNFFTIADDGVRLWIGEQLIIDDWQDHRARERSGIVTDMVAGQRYPIRLEYYENKGNAEIRLEWSSDNQARTTIPSAYLHPLDIVAPDFDASISDFTLVDANNGVAIMTLSDGITVNLYDLSTQRLSVVANTDQAVGSVTVSLNGNSRIENSAPYSLLGNNGNNHIVWAPEIGTHTISAIPYEERGASGTRGTGAEITIQVINEAPATATPLPPTSTPIPPSNTPVPVWSADVTELVLINANNGQTLFNLQNDMTLNLYNLPANLSVVAHTNSSSVGSVVMVLNDDSRIENSAPYSLLGNDGNNHIVWTPEIGQHTISAMPYEERAGRGTQGNGSTVTIQVINEAPATATPLPPTNTPIPPTSTPAPVWSADVTELILIDADNEQALANLHNGMTLNLYDLPANLSVVAHTNSNDIGSIVMSLNDDSRVENGAPYSLLGNNGSDYITWAPIVGQYIISATPYEERAGRGTQGNGLAVTITIIDEAPTSDEPVQEGWSASITSFNLINADTNQVISQLSNGSVIDLRIVPTRNLNIQAVTSNRVGSVVMNLNGGVRTENGAPYAIAGDDNGNYVGWTPSQGAYTMSATPYELANAQGIMGSGSTVTFSVVDVEEYTLNVQIVGNGLVTRNLNQVSYQQGTAVQLTVTPDAGWLFAGWSGDVISMDMPLTITMNSNMTLLATFITEPLSITIDPITNENGQGLNGEYFNSVDFTGTAVSRLDPNIDFYWDHEPISGIQEEGFSIRWTGWITPRYSETYTFTTTSDDGIRLWVNNTLLIDDWNAHSVQANSGVIQLVAGQAYDIRVEFFDDIGSAEVHLMWSSASQVQEIVPNDVLFAGRVSVIEPTPAPIVVNPPVPQPTLQDLVLTSTCAGSWLVANPSATAINFSWEVMGSGIRSAIMVAQPGNNILTTTPQQGQQESITVYFDLGDGQGERSVMAIGVSTPCP